MKVYTYFLKKTQINGQFNCKPNYFIFKMFKYVFMFRLWRFQIVFRFKNPLTND